MSADPLRVTPREHEVHTGLERDERKKLSELLGDVLASTYLLYGKTHAYHWNVEGASFFAIHKLTDEQYHELGEAIDGIAERIRAIGFLAPVGYGNYVERSIVADAADVPDARQMVTELMKDHELIAKQARDAAIEADNVNDIYSNDLLTRRVGVHEEAVWMLRSILERH